MIFLSIMCFCFLPYLLIWRVIPGSPLAFVVLLCVVAFSLQGIFYLVVFWCLCVLQVLLVCMVAFYSEVFILILVSG